MRRPTCKVRNKMTSVEETADRSSNVTSNEQDNLSIDESDSCSAVSIGQSSQRKKVSSDQTVERKGPWTPAEDKILVEYVKKHGEGNWNNVRNVTQLFRCGKSCRLRWSNHLKPGLKKGPFTPEEEQTVIMLHRQLGNKWSLMTELLPGRTDNEIKNFWNTRCKRMLRANLPIYPRELASNISIENRLIQRNGDLILPKMHHLKYDKLVAQELSVNDRCAIKGSWSSLPTYSRISANRVNPLLRSQGDGDSLTLMNHRKWAEAKAISLTHKACVSDAYVKQFRRRSSCVSYQPSSLCFASSSGPQSSFPTTGRAFLGDYANLGGSFSSSQPPCETLKVELPSLQTSMFEASGVDPPLWTLSSTTTPFTTGDGLLVSSSLAEPSTPSQSFALGNSSLIPQVQGYMPSDENHIDHISLETSSLSSKESWFDSIKVASDNLMATVPITCKTPLSSYNLTASNLDRKCLSATNAAHDVSAVNVETDSMLAIPNQNFEEKRVFQQPKPEASLWVDQSPDLNIDNEDILTDFGDDYLPNYLKCLITETVPFSVDDIFLQE